MRQQTRRLAAQCRDEAGAVAVMVALFVGTVGIASAAIAIDLGSAWASQRSLVTDTDAAALAGAERLANATRSECMSQQSLAESDTGDVYDTVVSVLDDNTATTEVLGVEIACPASASDPRGATVLVEAEQEAISAFAGAIGFDPIVANGMSAAEVGAAGSLGGLIPFVVCEDEFGDDSPLGPEDVGKTYPIPFARQTGQGCNTDGKPNNGSGNWGWTGFDGNIGNGSNSDPTCVDKPKPSLTCYLNQGFPETVSLEDNEEKCGDKDGSPGETRCEARPGLINSAVAEFWKVWGCPKFDDCEDKIFTFMVFDDISGPKGKAGTGGTAEYSITGFASAILRECNGETPNTDEGETCKAKGGETSLTFEIADYRASGAVGGPGTPASTVRTMSLCAVRGDEQGDRCALSVTGP